MLWPETTERDTGGALTVGGVSAVELADRFGTPLYVFDRATLLSRARRVVSTFTAAFPKTRIVYAGKAYLSPAIVSLLHREGLGLDVVSGGELSAGLKAGIPASEMTFHGNNKGEIELREAMQAGVGQIAVDNFDELSLLDRLTAELGMSARILLRVNPGIDVHTHDKIATGVADSKFGFPVWTGDAARAVERASSMPGLELAGYHAHIGSQLFDARAYKLTVQTLVTLAAEMRDRHGISPEIISPGGGFGIAYERSDEEAALTEVAAVVSSTLRRGCEDAGLALPELVVEPGRFIVGPAAIALYRVGSRKEIPGVRTYVSVDGGMADNIRPALYGARYEAALANRSGNGAVETVTIAGKYCESGDILVPDVELPPLRSGDLLAIPAVGAYCLPMASNYNLAPRPAVVLVEDGASHLIRRRETFDDLFVCDVLPV
ncbi:MAG: diaminopimelate decarboxylase [Thermomicrobiales bacterium]